jgi:hypothetical protein
MEGAALRPRTDNQGGCHERTQKPSREEITHVAYALYIQRGGEHGRDVEDWVRAERELSQEPVAGPAKTKTALAVRNSPN